MHFAISPGLHVIAIDDINSSRWSNDLKLEKCLIAAIEKRLQSIPQISVIAELNLQNNNVICAD